MNDERISKVKDLIGDNREGLYLYQNDPHVHSFLMRYGSGMVDAKSKDGALWKLVSELSEIINQSRKNQTTK
jgi:hypothetical protein